MKRIKLLWAFLIFLMSAPLYAQQEKTTAVLHMEFMSHTLLRKVPVTVILPVQYEAQLPMKTLYLLHGMFGGNNDWLYLSNIVRYAEMHRLCVVMPSGDNHFYVDMPQTHNNYSQFIGKELVRATRAMFPLSGKREDTYIGGLSMGGFGAMMNGLRYTDTFGAIIALSPGLLLEGNLDVSRLSKDPNNILNETFYHTVFGDLSRIDMNENNPRKLLINLKERAKTDKNVQIPTIYIANGTEDRLIQPLLRTFLPFLDEQRIPYTYEEGKGGHDFTFWDTYIKRALDRLSEGRE